MMQKDDNQDKEASHEKHYEILNLVDK